MYLPDRIDQAQVCITVKTYPLPSKSYGETVCTAGFLDTGKWIRIYPVTWQVLRDDQKYPKYSWIQLDLDREINDFRQETYKPRKGFDEDIRVIKRVGTENAWEVRKQIVLKEVFTSMQDLIALAKSPDGKSLAVLQPAEIIDFVIEEEPEKGWKEKWIARSRQMSIFDLDKYGLATERRLIKKLPYRFKYRFMASGEDRPRELTIQDWEIGALYWNCLKRAGGDEEIAKQQVREKYFDDFLTNKDLYFFLGTNFVHHRKNALNPFMIVGVFYPPKTSQTSMFHP